jgi:IS5 family transposase
MKPVRRGRSNPDLFRERLDAIIDMRHSLVHLAGLLPWSAFDESFGKFFKPIGRPAKPTRLMVGLHYLKHVYNLSDEEVVERWVENAYHQYFCGFEFFQHELPIDPSSMTRWRKRVGPDALEEVLKATVAVALETGTVKPSSLERVTVDTTVQPKAIAHPTDSRFYENDAHPGGPGEEGRHQASPEPHAPDQKGGGEGGALRPHQAVQAHAPGTQALEDLSRPGVP